LFEGSPVSHTPTMQQAPLIQATAYGRMSSIRLDKAMPSGCRNHKTKADARTKDSMVNPELRLLELFGSVISVLEIILIHNEHIIPSIWRRAADDRIRSSKLRFPVKPWPGRMRQQEALRHTVTLQSPTRIKLQARYSGGTRPRTLTNWTTPRPESKSISKTYHSARWWMCRSS
jgi:hypothetical protein